MQQISSNLMRSVGLLLWTPRRGPDVSAQDSTLRDKTFPETQVTLHPS